MSEMERCDLHELLGCGVCSGVDKQQQQAMFKVDVDGPRIEARFNGRCACCGRAYEAGATIGHSSECGWVAECCV